MEDRVEIGLTVLLPVFNGAATLRQAIESILGQDEQQFELLVIDDKSSDASAGIAASFAAQDRRLKLVVHERNAGLSATLNEGLELARGALVARMDQDDESLRGRLRTQRTFMERHPEIAVAGSDVLHMGASPRFDRLVRVPHTPREIASRLQQENCLYHPTVVMRRDLVLAQGGYREAFKNAEDYDLWLRLARRHDLANIPEPLLRYRFSPGGMTLGRKWEQLYFVHLAQAANSNSSLPLAELEVIARATLADVDRRDFLRQVAAGTVDELVRLRLWREASLLVSRFAGDNGPAGTATLAARLSRTAAREALRRAAYAARTRL